MDRLHNGSIPPFVHSTFSVSFGRESKRCWSILPGGYATVSKRSHTRSKLVTCREFTTDNPLILVLCFPVGRMRGAEHAVCTAVMSIPLDVHESNRSKHFLTIVISIQLQFTPYFATCNGNMYFIVILSGHSYRQRKHIEPESSS